MNIQRTSLQDLLKSPGQLVIDGSMSTALEHMGVELNHRLWTAKALIDCPEKVKQVHKNYFKAGADCGITCSYQATIPGLMSIGCTETEAEHEISGSVRLLLEAREEWWAEEGRSLGRAWPLCLAGIGPYGAYLADGSEYRGNYGVSPQALREFHTRRMRLLWEAGADLLLIETQPSLEEVLIEADIAEGLQAEYWISFSCRDETHINDGTPIAVCAEKLSKGHPRLRMIGVNCTKPAHIAGLIGELRRHTALPIAVYPNSGEEYDPVTKTWHGEQDGNSFYEYALEYFRSGAAAVGGCCTTVETHIRQVVEARMRFQQDRVPV